MAGKSPKVVEKAEEKQTPRFKKPWIVIGIVILLIVAAIPSAFFYKKYHDAKTLGSATKNAQTEVEDLVLAISKLIELPTGEQPTVATVSDKTKLANQPFFTRAENGDKVLIYTNAKKAFLYRPSTNKIIEVGPINIPTEAAQVQGTNTTALVSGTPSPSGGPTKKEEQLTVSFYNGTKVNGLTKDAEAKLKGETADFSVITRGNAKNDYTTTVVVDLSGEKYQQASDIASIMGGEVGALPEGEDKPSSDILIILGADFKTE